MRPLHALTLSAALALALTAPLRAEEAATISVTGTGTVETVPDIATLSIGVTTSGETAAAALAANSAAIETVMARLTASGIEARDMQTSGLSLYPNWSDASSSSMQTIAAMSQPTS